MGFAKDTEVDASLTTVTVQLPASKTEAPITNTDPMLNMTRCIHTSTTSRSSLVQDGQLTGAQARGHSIVRRRGRAGGQARREITRHPTSHEYIPVHNGGHGEFDGSRHDRSAIQKRRAVP